MTNEHVRSVGLSASLLLLLCVAAALNSGCDSCKAPGVSPHGRSRLRSALAPKTDGVGALDASFGTGGKVTAGTAGSVDEAISAAFDANGRIVVAGSVTPAGAAHGADFAVWRFADDGSLDARFGDGGRVTTDFFGVARGDDYATGVLVQPDGKILVAGAATARGGDVTSLVVALARYDAAGELDASFGDGGKVTTDVGGTGSGATAVALQPDGKIVVAGGVDMGNDLLDYAIVRYDADGSPDESFGSGGKVTTDFAHDADAPGALLVQPDGKILLAGCSYVAGGTGYDCSLARYDADGTPDATFGSGGKTTINFNAVDRFDFDGVVSLALQPDGKILAAGSTETDTADYFHDFALLRLDADGTPDATFGSNGRAETDISGISDQAASVLLQPDGKILVGGLAGGRAMPGTNGIQIVDQDTATGSRGSDFALVRYTAGGALDTAFGDGGILTTDFFGAADAARFFLDPQERVLAVGFAQTTPLSGAAQSLANTDVALARYDVGLAPVPDFALSIDPTAATIQVGKTATATLSIAHTNGFAGKVTVTATDLSAAKIKVKPANVSTSATSVAVKIKAKKTATPGTYDVTFTGTDKDGRTRTATFTLTVQ